MIKKGQKLTVVEHKKRRLKLEYFLGSLNTERYNNLPLSIKQALEFVYDYIKENKE